MATASFTENLNSIKKELNFLENIDSNEECIIAATQGINLKKTISSLL